MNKIKQILPHFTIALSLMFVIFFILDKINPMMNFTDNSISNILLVVLCLLSTATSVIAIVLDRKNR